MAQPVNTGEEQHLSELVSGILEDAQKLMRQELALARTEIREEVFKFRNTAFFHEIAASVLGFGALLLTLALTFGFQALTGIPLWASFLIMGLVYAAAGYAVYIRGRKGAHDLNLVPRQTVETMKENVRWLKSQTT